MSFPPAGAPCQARPVEFLGKMRCRDTRLAEWEDNWFKHQFARHCPDSDVKQQLALTRRLEQQQQKMVNCLIPGNETVLEITLGYEQAARSSRNI